VAQANRRARLEIAEVAAGQAARLATAAKLNAVRDPIDATRLRQLLERLGRHASGPGRIYLTGGATALLEGWRSSTVDVDLKLDPEPAGIFEAIACLKHELQVNIELASPDQFLPPLPDWKEHSRFIVRHGPVEFFHYDMRSQALAKLARAHDRDLFDVRAMLERGLVSRSELRRGLDQIRDRLIRYPALDAEAFERRVQRLLQSSDD
jgi:hypothetical protein